MRIAVLITGTLGLLGAVGLFAVSTALRWQNFTGQADPHPAPSDFPGPTPLAIFGEYLILGFVALCAVSGFVALGVAATRGATGWAMSFVFLGVGAMCSLFVWLNAQFGGGLNDLEQGQLTPSLILFFAPVVIPLLALVYGLRMRRP